MATAMVNTAAITETANNRFDNPGQAVNPAAFALVNKNWTQK